MKIKNSNFLICLICVLLFDKWISYEITNPNYLIYMENKQCNLEKCSTLGGICKSNIKCECKQCYTTIINDNQIFCNYSQSSSTTAALIELLIPIGIGHFYRGSISFGFLKMIIGYMMFYGIYVIIIYYFIYTRTFNEELSRPLTRSYQSITVTIGEDIKKLNQIVLISQILFFILHLLDVYLLFSSNYLDGNNVLMC